MIVVKKQLLVQVTKHLDLNMLAKNLHVLMSLDASKYAQFGNFVQQSLQLFAF